MSAHAKLIGFGKYLEKIDGNVFKAEVPFITYKTALGVNISK